jgi:hypothetical protein
VEVVNGLGHERFGEVVEEAFSRVEIKGKKEEAAWVSVVKCEAVDIINSTI